MHFTVIEFASLAVLNATVMVGFMGLSFFLGRIYEAYQWEDSDEE